MRKLTQVLRLHFESKLSIRQIARSLNISVGVVSKYINRATECNISWPLSEEVDEQKLTELLKSPSLKSNCRKSTNDIDFAKIHQELKLKTVTLQLLWEEYKTQVSTPLSYSRFCHHYRIYKQSLKRSMRQTHKAGDKVFIDYSGVTFDIIDPETGEVRAAEIFVGVLGCSKYTFAEATWSQQLPDFLASQRHMFEFFGGVPALIVPDNLRSAITKTCRYEPEVNPTYAQFVEYYATAVLPARPYKPKDKPSVESGVQVVQRWILGRLRHQTFLGLTELNIEIKRLLKNLNTKPFQKLPGCRESVFLEIDKPQLKPLPPEGYEYRYYKISRAGIDYHFALNGHYYSVPHKYCGELIDLWVNRHTVECYFKGQLIATHLYSEIAGQQSTIAHHMPKRHRKQSEQSKERFLKWSEQIGIYTHTIVKKILEEKSHIEQAYRACLGLLTLSKKYGEKRLEKACSYGVQQGVYSQKSILSILQNNLDQASNISINIADEKLCVTSHENIRGSHYYH